MQTKSVLCSVECINSLYESWGDYSRFTPAFSEKKKNLIHARKRICMSSMAGYICILLYENISQL